MSLSNNGLSGFAMDLLRSMDNGGTWLTPSCSVLSAADDDPIDLTPLLLPDDFDDGSQHPKYSMIDFDIDSGLLPWSVWQTDPFDFN